MTQNTPPAPRIDGTQENSSVIKDFENEAENNSEETSKQEEPTNPAPNIPIPGTVNEIGTHAIESKAPATVDQGDQEVKLLEYNQYNNVNQMLKAASVLIDSGVLPNNITEPE